MRVASYNVENLFDRPLAMKREQQELSSTVLTAYSKVNRLFQKAAYSEPDKQQMIELLEVLGLSSQDAGEYAILRQNHGRLLKRPQGKPMEIVAGGRGDWVGWLELVKGHVNEIAVQMTAKVIRAVNAGVLGVVEVENRPALLNFNEQLIGQRGGTPYDHVMVIDGNDETRGIDVGILTRAEYPIVSMCSHVDDRLDEERIFSRDCPEYEVRLPSGESLWVLMNHFKSKGYGGAAENDARRKEQAQRVRQIYEARRAAGARLIAVMGDLNDTPESDPLSPLLKERSSLRDIFEHPKFQGDGRPGTYGNGTASGKLDYILCSPALYERVSAAGVFREGVWGGTHGTLFPHFPEMTAPQHAASDHAAIWADLDL